MAGFQRAAPQQAALKMGLYGAQGSGKTFTALLVAEGLAKLSGKKIAFVDTERGTDFYAQKIKDRRVHPEGFVFDALYSRSLVDVLNAVRELKPEEYGVIVLDSVTHLWEAAKASYAGKLTAQGGIPLQAWSQIKRPYKQLMAALLSSPMHVLILGRQGLEMADDDDGEVKVVGYKMKAEGETAYEPHILIRMEQQRHGKQQAEATIRAIVEKDRSGVLAGKMIEWPNYELLAAPLIPYLGKQQAKIESEDDAGARDAVVLAEEEKQKVDTSAETVREMLARISLSKSAADLDIINKAMTPEVKKAMTTADVAAVRESWLEAAKKFPKEKGAKK